MGLKGESGYQRPTATGEQLRFAQLTLEGKSSDDDPSSIQRLIKKVIETTRCTQAQAELALYDNDNDLAAAVDYLLENSAEIDSWTEQKSKKEKKKDEEERRPFRGQSSRGRGGYSDRGGRGRGTAPSKRGTSRGASVARGTPVARRGRGTSHSNTSSGGHPQVKPVDTDLNDESSDWRTGPMEFKRSVEPVATPSSSTVSSGLPASSGSATVSFAAVAAAAARKEEEMKKKQIEPPAEAPHSYEAEFLPDEPATSVECEADIKDTFQLDSSPTRSEEENDAPDSEHELEPPSSPVLQANASWTNQLKSELGIGLPVTSDVSPRQPSFSAKPQSLAPAPAAVEFDTDAPSGLVDYQFGFVESPATAVDLQSSVPSAPTPSSDPIFSGSRHSVVNLATQKPLEAERNLTNGDYSLKPSTESNLYGRSGQISARALGFGDASSVSYTPVERQQAAKASTVPHSQHQQQSQSHQQHLYPQQMPYSAYQYMYNPGVRTEDPYSAAALMQYPFSGMNVDLSTILPGANTMGQSGSTQQQMPSNQHRGDSHSLENMKYQSQNSRDQGQQQANVAPPPGFGTGNFMPQQALTSLFMQQQQYQPHPYQFMMPNVAATAGRMYQDEERKAYDKMGSAKQAQSTPPLYQQNYHNMGGINKKTYTWNS